VRDRSDQKEAIRERADIVEIVSQYVTLKQSGRVFKALCPFHSEKTASFQVDPERGLWRCFGACQTGGDVFSFVQKMDNLTFPEAAEKLARRYGLPFQRGGESVERASERERLLRVNALAEWFFREQYRRAPQVQAYVARRGLSPEAVEQFRLGFAPGHDRLAAYLSSQKVSPAEGEQAGLLVRGENGYRDRFWNRLIFPILDVEGRPIAFGGRTMEEQQPKYLNSPETPIFKKGRTLFGLHLARKGIPAAGCAVVVEGYMDLIACQEAGFSQTVATLGTAITPEVIRLLRRYTSQLVLAYDGDSAGLGAALRSAPAFEEADCEVRIVRLPAGKDPDSVIREEGAASFQQLLNEAEPLVEYHLGALARRHDLSTPAGRLALVQEAARIVSQLRSTVAREHHRGQFERRLRKLAEQWHPGDAARAVEAERALRLELQRAWNRPSRPLTPVRPDEFDSGAGTAGREPVRPLTGDTKAEALLLRAALTEARWADQIEAALGGEPLDDPRHQCVAAALFGHTESEWSARIEAIRADPELTEIASGLLVVEAGPPLSEAQIVGALARLVRRCKQRRKKELVQGIVQGRITKGDAEYQEYLQLVNDLGGQGLKGEGESASRSNEGEPRGDPLAEPRQGAGDGHL
jgi:DNA primase